MKNSFLGKLLVVIGALLFIHSAYSASESKKNGPFIKCVNFNFYFLDRKFLKLTHSQQFDVPLDVKINNRNDKLNTLIIFE